MKKWILAVCTLCATLPAWSQSFGDLGSIGLGAAVDPMAPLSPGFERPVLTRPPLIKLPPGRRLPGLPGGMGGVTVGGGTINYSICRLVVSGHLNRSVIDETSIASVRDQAEEAVINLVSVRNILNEKDSHADLSGDHQELLSFLDRGLQGIAGSYAEVLLDSCDRSEQLKDHSVPEESRGYLEEAMTFVRYYLTFDSVNQ